MALWDFCSGFRVNALSSNVRVYVYSGSVSRWLMHMSYLILAVSDGIFTLSFLILNSRIVHEYQSKRKYLLMTCVWGIILWYLRGKMTFKTVVYQTLTVGGANLPGMSLCLTSLSYSSAWHKYKSLTVRDRIPEDTSVYSWGSLFVHVDESRVNFF